jgi:hypothetical protein
MALSKSLSIRKICFSNNDKTTKTLTCSYIYGECGKNSVAAVDVYNTMVDTFYTIICFNIKNPRPVELCW